MSEPPKKITWEDPPSNPKTPRKGSKWDPIAAELKKRPGQWARIVTQDEISVITSINRGGLICFQPAGSFEAVARDFSGRWTADVYARYVGEDQEYADET